MPFGGAPKCPVCDKSVYFAEECKALGRSWHIVCFKCSDCNKKLDSTTANDHDNRLFCKGCYGKNFGPAGYGFSGGASGLRTDAGQREKIHTAEAYVAPMKPVGGNKFGGSERCGACGKSVYLAEKVIGAGQAWHKQCFRCKSCNKSLDSTTVADKEGEIYCKGCYGKQFGPKGVGYGIGAGTLST